MSRNIFKYVGAFFGLILLQLLLFNNIQFSGFVNPYIYVLFILILPFETPKGLILLLGFLLGISIDVFTGTIGYHASATVFMAFMRPTVLKLISPRDGYDLLSTPRVSHYGLGWFLKYSASLVLFHHFWLFIIESFKFSMIGFVLLKVMLSAVFSLFFIVISQYLILKE